MDRVNLFAAECERNPADPAGFEAGMARIDAQLEARELAVRLFELPPGQSICPFHYEYVEEWLVVLDGEVAVRTPEAEEQWLYRGDAVCFPAGPGGAHKVTNATDDSTARVIMFSSASRPAVAVYPDSDKIGVWVARAEDHVMLRRADGQVDYWDGETAERGRRGAGGGAPS